MAFNFPNPPVPVDTEYEHYKWDGEKWNIGAATVVVPPEGDAGEPVGPWLWLLKG
jgi:hypothetical protein